MDRIQQLVEKRRRRSMTKLQHVHHLSRRLANSNSEEDGLALISQCSLLTYDVPDIYLSQRMVAAGDPTSFGPFDLEIPFAVTR